MEGACLAGKWMAGRGGDGLKMCLAIGYAKEKAGNCFCLLFIAEMNPRTFTMTLPPRSMKTSLPHPFLH